MRHYLYLLILSVLIFVSCETELPEGTWSKEPPVNPENPVTYQLSINKTTIVAEAEGSSETFSITSDDNWTISASETWLKISETSGSGDKTITVSVSTNSTTAERSGKISIKGSNSSIENIITVMQQAKPMNVIGGHEFVDLGLPSGLLWATCNVGAEKPEDYGDYFAWGETTTNSTYGWSTYKYCNGSYATLTKYNNTSSYGTVDDKTVLEPEDDAAHVNWGGSWRMPTKAEQDELRDSNNCVWTWTTKNDVQGYKVTSKRNGNTIFLPAAGYRKDSSLYQEGLTGLYLSSSLTMSDPILAYSISFSSSEVGCNSYYRYCERTIRSVCATLE